MKKALIVANWKMHKTRTQGRDFIQKLRRLSVPRDREVVICAPFTVLSSLDWKNLGAQDMFWEASGAYTGEISPVHVKDAGCTWVLLGHSERRQYFSETDSMIQKKLAAAVQNDIKPIVCVGETREQRKRSQTFRVLRKQIQALKRKSGFVVAYEPLWAIGTGVNATPEEAQLVHVFLKKLVSVPIIYGGSVKPENTASFMAQSAIDGLLVGGASLNFADFRKIILSF